MLKGLLDLCCKLMIDIDTEIDEDWKNPKPGFKLKEEQNEDSVVFALECLNRIFNAAGEEIVMGPIQILIENLLGNNDDWRFKNAGLYILSQIGEFTSEMSMFEGPLMTSIISHLQHENPKIRYATIHCLGQLASDLKQDFTERFHEEIISQLIEKLNDPIIRIQAHAASAISNIFENLPSDIGPKYLAVILPILISKLESGSTCLMESSVTAFSSVAESCGTSFDQYYEESLKILMKYLYIDYPKEYKQFKGQLIEAIVMISVHVSPEVIKKYQAEIVKGLLFIQNNQIDQNYDP